MSIKNNSNGEREEKTEKRYDDKSIDNSKDVFSRQS